MKRRRVLLLVLVTIIFIGSYNIAALVFTTAKIFRYTAVFDWWRGPVSLSTVSIGTIPADIYTSLRSRFPILVVHGVNETGKNSPEVKPLAEALAGSGFRVVVPEFERLTRQNVTPADVDAIASVFRSLETDGGILCASYGCGPALIAAGRPEIRDRVRFVVTFGSYFDLTDALRFIITSPPTPLAYSKWTYLAANSDLIQDERDRRMLLAIADERRQQPPGLWTISGESLGRDARALLALCESHTPAEFDARLSETPLVRNRAERLSPSRYFDGLHARLIIVHIFSDPSIPSRESVRMAEAAKARGIPYSLTILNMYGHTRPEWPDFGIRSLFGFYLPEGWKFIRALNEILSFA